MRKSTTATTCITLPLKVEPWQADILNKRFYLAFNIYNAFINITMKKYNTLIHSNEYKEIQRKLKELADEGKKGSAEWRSLGRIRYDLLKKAGFTEFGFTGMMTKCYKVYSSNINSTIAASISNSVWRAYESMIFRNGTKVCHKELRDFNIISGKGNASGIRYINGKIIWKELEMPVRFDKDNLYEQRMLQRRIKFCRLKRIYTNSRYHFFAQLVLEGKTELKYDVDTGKLIHPIGEGKVGLNITATKVSYVTEDKTGTICSGNIQNLLECIAVREKEISELRKYLERSRRVTNPDNYNADGTIKEQENKKLVWKYSKGYIRARNRLKNTYRKQVETRKILYNCLANEVMALGNEFYITKQDYAVAVQTANGDKRQYNYKNGVRGGDKKNNWKISPSALINIIQNKAAIHECVEVYLMNFKDKDKLELSSKCKDEAKGGVKINAQMHAALLMLYFDKTLREIDEKEGEAILADFTSVAL